MSTSSLRIMLVLSVSPFKIISLVPSDVWLGHHPRARLKNGNAHSIFPSGGGDFCNVSLNLFISSPQDVQQTGKRDSLSERRVAVYFLWFLSHYLTYERLFGLPVSDLVFRRIHELQDACCSFWSRHRAGCVQAQAPNPPKAAKAAKPTKAAPAAPVTTVAAAVKTISGDMARFRPIATLASLVGRSRTPNRKKI